MPTFRTIEIVVLSVVCCTTALPKPSGICSFHHQIVHMAASKNTDDAKPLLRHRRINLHQGDKHQTDEREDSENEIDRLIPPSDMHHPSTYRSVNEQDSTSG